MNAVQSFHCAEGAALDTGNLHVSGDRIASHPEVMFKG
jgi:hypothetical protein